MIPCLLFTALLHICYGQSGYDSRYMSYRPSALGSDYRGSYAERYPPGPGPVASPEYYDSGYHGSSPLAYDTGYPGGVSEPYASVYHSAGSPSYDSRYQGGGSTSYDPRYQGGGSTSYDSRYQSAGTPSYDSGYQSSRSAAYDPGYQGGSLAQYSTYQGSSSASYDSAYQGSRPVSYDPGYQGGSAAHYSTYQGSTSAPYDSTYQGSRPVSYDRGYQGNGSTVYQNRQSVPYNTGYQGSGSTAYQGNRSAPHDTRYRAGASGYRGSASTSDYRRSSPVQSRRPRGRSYKERRSRPDYSNVFSGRYAQFTTPSPRKTRRRPVIYRRIRGPGRSRTHERGRQRHPEQFREGYIGARGGQNNFPFMGGYCGGDPCSDGGLAAGVGDGIGTGSLAEFLRRRRAGENEDVRIYEMNAGGPGVP